MGIPPAQFTLTSDGLRIAFRRFGDGPAVLFASNIWGDASFYHVDPDVRTMTDRLVEAGRSVIRYDIRGMGLSDRGVDDFSLDARLRDLEAVAGDLRLPEFVLGGFDGAGATAMAYAARHPEQIIGLVLINAWETGKQRYESNPPARSLAHTEPMAQDEWEYFTLALGSLVTHYEDPNLAAGLAAQYRASTTPQVFSAYRRHLKQLDVSDITPTLRLPTLVLHDRLFAFAAEELSRQLAARIPSALLQEVEGSEAAAEAVVAFTRSLRHPASDAWNGESEAGISVATPVQTKTARLTRRELEVLRLIASGRTNQEICNDLFLSVRTVGRHITNIYAKIDARNRSEATAYAIHHRLT